MVHLVSVSLFSANGTDVEEAATCPPPHIALGVASVYSAPIQSFFLKKVWNLTLFPMLECCGSILAHCSLLPRYK